MRQSVVSAVLLLTVLQGSTAFSVGTPRTFAPGHVVSSSIGQHTFGLSAAQRNYKANIVASAGDVVVKEDYKLAIGFAAVGLILIVAPWLIGVPALLLSILFFVQTLRVRFVFDETSIEVKAKEFDKLFESDAALVDSGENFAVGGENRWSYDSIVNWEFFPSEDIPILVYFKETQTPEDKWDVGPGKWANSAEALAKGAVKGQVHFFPCIVDKDSIKEQFVTRGCGKL